MAEVRAPTAEHGARDGAVGLVNHPHLHGDLRRRVVDWRPRVRGVVGTPGPIGRVRVRRRSGRRRSGVRLASPWLARRGCRRGAGSCAPDAQHEHEGCDPSAQLALR
jgi:hypothetical protein